MSRADKHVVSVSLGSSARDVDVTVELLGERGAHRAARHRRRRQGRAAPGRRARRHVDAIGLGGLDLFLQWMGRRYYFREARTSRRGDPHAGRVRGRPQGLARAARGGPARRERRLARPARALTIGVDRFGMAEALVEHGADVRFGDLMFTLGLPWPIRSMRALDAVARTIGPALTKLPVSWLYPTGSSQTATTTTSATPALPLGRGRRRRLAQRSGATHPARLDGLTILTNTTTKADVAFLARPARRGW
jgi:hypothetical protein